MDRCDMRICDYKDGRTFDDCKKTAKSLNPVLKDQLKQRGKLLWTDILKESEFDAVVFKLSLKYLRQDGYDIGTGKNPVVTMLS